MRCRFRRMTHYTLLLITPLAFNQALASDAASTDRRTSLGLNANEKAAFLSEMRQMLASVQGVIAGIGDENPEKIAAAARQSGGRMARATPESIRNKLPQSFKELGGPTHMLFEELAIRADTDDMQSLASFTGELMQQCTACHEKFKVD